MPIPPQAQRLSVTASRLGLATGSSTEPVGPSVVLGSQASSNVLQLAFVPGWKGREVLAAFLVLDPIPLGLGASDVPLEVVRLRGPWAPAAPNRGAQSPLALPRAGGVGRSSLPVRIDVTPIVAHWADSPWEAPALAVRASRDVPPGLAIATGFDGGVPPYLDLYFEPLR